MERLQSDVRAFYERQANKLLNLARDCTETKGQQKLIEMASEYIDKLDISAAEKLISDQGKYRIELPFDAIRESGGLGRVRSGVPP